MGKRKGKKGGKFLVRLGTQTIQRLPNLFTIASLSIYKKYLSVLDTIIGLNLFKLIFNIIPLYFFGLGLDWIEVGLFYCNNNDSKNNNSHMMTLTYSTRLTFPDPWSEYGVQCTVRVCPAFQSPRFISFFFPFVFNKPIPHSSNADRRISITFFFCHVLLYILAHTSTTSSILLNTQQSYGRHQIKICKLGYLRMHSVAVVVVVGCRRSNSFGFSTPNTPSPRVPRNFLESRLLQAILLFTARA